MEAAGLWSWLDPDVRAEIIRSARQGASPVMGLHAHGWRADGEDLAEGDVGELLGAVRPALLREGVDLAVETLTGPHDQNSPGYVVRVNGVDIELYRYDPSEPGVPATRDPWMDCTRLPLHRVNELLEASGSSRRMAVFSPAGMTAWRSCYPRLPSRCCKTSPRSKKRNARSCRSRPDAAPEPPAASEGDAAVTMVSGW